MADPYPPQASVVVEEVKSDYEKSDAINGNENEIANLSKLIEELLSEDQKELKEQSKLKEELPDHHDDCVHKIPEADLQTNPSTGLTTPEVLKRRRDHGRNVMKEEKKSEIMKFLHFFRGPIAAVMIVRTSPSCRQVVSLHLLFIC